ncbi:ribonucleoprotein PTB-binding 1 isoform X5 [Gouania willdenowi]|uniref:ribonucleoprotein PTB-binding 1 isoform X5 n=1 Tax=Gouania willdenowi TaxID=441366 RepID=UPI001054450F|nr:ribonucleoprotein PTB-binding 1 isoform X5 [Gouania willdenowi]
MAYAVSDCTTECNEGADTGPGLAPRFSKESCDQENSPTGDRRFAEVEQGGEEDSGLECQRRVDEDLASLSPEEIQGRLERTRREFYNRRKIIIKNLPSDVSNQEVHDLLGSYDLKYCFVDKYKGTAFVTLLNGEQAQSAIKEFHQHTLRDREITVQLQPTDALLCIANLPRAFTHQQFEELVRPFGNLERCFLVYSATTGHSKGYGFVEYMKKDSAARAKSELLGKQLGSRMLYVHWTEVGSLTYPLLHSKCLCVDRLPSSLLTAPDLRNALADTHSPVFCQLAQGQDGSFKRFAVLEFPTGEMAEEAQRLTDGRLLAGTHIRVSFCAPGPPGRSMLAALIAAQTMAVNRGKGLLPDPTAMQILTSLNNPATLKMLLNPLSQGQKQGLFKGLLGAAPPMPLLANPAISAALLQLLLQNQAKAQQQAFLGNQLLLAQQAGLIGENPLAALAVQQGHHLLGDLPQGGGLGLQQELLSSLKPMSLSRPLAREQESPTLGCTFPQTTSPTLQGLSMPLMGGSIDGLIAQGVSILGDPSKESSLTQSAFLNASSAFPSGGSCRPHPYRKRPTLSNMSNQLTAHHSQQQHYNLRYPDSYSSDYLSHQDVVAQRENLDAVAGFGLQPRHRDCTEQFPLYNLPPSPPLSSYFTSGPETLCSGSPPITQLNRVSLWLHIVWNIFFELLILPPPLSVWIAKIKVTREEKSRAVGMPPVSHTTNYPPGLGNMMRTPIGSHKRVFSRLIPSPEPSPEGGYVGQHSQGLGGHYADSYLKRKRIL